MGAQSVERALSLLVAIAEAGAPVGVTDLARQVGLHPATAHRLVGSLVETGFAAQDADTARYRLGPTFLRLARTERERVDLPDLARPILDRLVRATGETAGAVQLDADGKHTVVVARVYSSHALRVHTPIGGRGPLHATAVGKVLLAHLPETERERILAGSLPAHTDHTITDPAALRAECAAIVQTGYATGVEDHRVGVSTVAAPVFDRSGQAVAALSLSGPVSRMVGDRLAELARLTHAAAADLSREFGADVDLDEPAAAGAAIGPANGHRAIPEPAANGRVLRASTTRRDA